MILINQERIREIIREEFAQTISDSHQQILVETLLNLELEVLRLSKTMENIRWELKTLNECNRRRVRD